jgi:hypothetical protein
MNREETGRAKLKREQPKGKQKKIGRASCRERVYTVV